MYSSKDQTITLVQKSNDLDFGTIQIKLAMSELQENCILQKIVVKILFLRAIFSVFLIFCHT